MNRRLFVAGSLLAVIGMLSIACENETSTLADNTCEGCHTDKAMLQQYASELPPDSGVDGGG